VSAPRRVAVVGAGAIGASWCARFLANDLDVVVVDPDDGARARLEADVARALDQLHQLGAEPAPWADRIVLTADLDAAVDGVALVQESAPESLDVKRQLLGELDAAAAASVIIASSSSGFTPSELQVACTHHPERVLVGHPFHPPHLIPLVEVVGGRRTDPAVVERAMAFYRGLGQTPIHVRAELPGHVTNRLQAALWREAYWLVGEGVASVADIDTAISNGPGLRWALAGPFVTQHLAGGTGGIAHVLAHLGPPMVQWWSTLGEPEWTEELQRAIVEGVAAELDGADTEEVTAARDALLVELLTAKRRAGRR
jgi:3-hydroxyacyl-CoA dehydrogenase